MGAQRTVVRSSRLSTKRLQLLSEEEFLCTVQKMADLRLNMLVMLHFNFYRVQTPDRKSRLSNPTLWGQMFNKCNLDQNDPVVCFCFLFKTTISGLAELEMGRNIINVG